MNVIEKCVWSGLALLCLGFPSVTRATAQMPDTLVLDGEEVPLFTNPLDPYLVERPNLLPKPEVLSSANWRGYTATWRIQDGALLLARVTMTVVDPTADASGGERYMAKDVLALVFPGATTVEATWYSGTLVIPRGREVEYVHMGYGSTYERYSLIHVRAGKVLSRIDLDHPAFIQYREEKFRAFQKSSLYRQQLDELTSGDQPWSRENADNFLRSFYAELYLSATVQ